MIDGIGSAGCHPAHDVRGPDVRPSANRRKGSCDFLEENQNGGRRSPLSPAVHID